MSYFTTLLYAFGQIFEGRIDRGTMCARYGAALAAVENMRGDPKADAFLQADSCTKYDINHSTRRPWVILGEQMLRLIRNDCRDYQVYELHMMLLRNPTYNRAFRGEELAVIDDDSAWIKLIDETKEH